MRLHQLRSPNRKKKKRVGRGIAAGGGKTAGRGTKGQKARTSSGNIPKGFEGGQSPQKLRLPKKKGFWKYPRIVTEIVNLKVIDRKFAEDERVDPKNLVKKGLISSVRNQIKILGNGNLNKKLEFDARLSFSKNAREKILKSGGKII